MKKYFIVAFGLMLVVSFQNCAKQPSAGSSASVSSAQQYTQTSAASYKQITLWDYDSSNQQFLDVDLTTGQMIAFEQQGTVRGATYCLTTTDLQQVNSILAQAQVCEPVAEAPSGQQACSDVYVYPYASLVSQNPQTEIRLGEKLNGCYQPTDLCGDSAQQFKNFALSVINNLASKTCN